MAVELKLLGVAVLIGIVHIVLQAQFATAQKGFAWNVGPRDENGAPLRGMAGRLSRAFDNFRETFPLFAAVVLAAVLAGKTNEVTYWGALAYVVARAAYIPLYAFAVSYVRSLVWAVGTGGIVAILIALFQ